MQASDSDLEVLHVEGSGRPVERHQWLLGPGLGLAILVLFVIVAAIAG